MQIQKQMQVRKKIQVLIQIKLQVVTVLLEEPNKLYIQDIRKGLQVTTFGDIGCLFRDSPFSIFVPGKITILVIVFLLFTT